VPALEDARRHRLPGSPDRHSRTVANSADAKAQFESAYETFNHMAVIVGR
jgi:hypothetical protein